MSSLNQLLRQPPSGALVRYPPTEAGKVLTVLADGTVDPEPATGGSFPPANAHIVFVSPVFGNDVTGDGSMAKPFATIAHAYSTITTASGTQIWQIVLFQGTANENVALRPFIEIVGWDGTQTFSTNYPARINGTVSLDATFSTPGAHAWITACDISGTVTFGFVATGSADGNVSITNCQLEDTYTATMVSTNSIELHGSTLVGDYVQQGGSAIWENTAGAGVSLLHLQALGSSGGSLKMYDSSWDGDVHVDQNGVVTGGVVPVLTLINSSARNGSLTITAAGANCPTIDAAYGDLPENPTLAGSAAAALPREVRISRALTVPSGTNVLANATLDVTIPLAAGVLGATSIEQMSCDFTPVGAWGVQLAKCTWSFYVLDNAGTEEVHVVICNTTDNNVLTSANLTLFFYAFAPVSIV